MSKIRQRGGALRRRKPRLIDKLAFGTSFLLAGPAPTFTTAAGKLAGQALKGIMDNIKHYRRRRK